MQAGKYFILLLIISCLLFQLNNTQAQNTGINFHKLGFNEGLHDGIIRCIAQDKLGYIWIGSVGAINRFNGKRVTRFTYQPGDSTTPFNSQPRSMYNDAEGRFWIGSETGLMEYDFVNNWFKRIPSLKKIFIQCIAGAGDSLLFLVTRNGLLHYNKRNGAVFNYTLSALPAHAPLFNNPPNTILYHNKLVYIGTRNGLVVYNPATGKAEAVAEDVLSGSGILSISNDKKNNIWICATGRLKLAKLSPDLKTISIYDKIFKAGDVNEDFGFISVVNDRYDSTWVISDGNGLFQIHPATKKYKRFVYNPVYPSGPSTNSWQCIFRDASGIIWLGCNQDGVNYFEPDKNLFTTLLPFPDLKGLRSGATGRGVTVDNSGNIWMGNHDGLSRYNPVTETYTTWRNEEDKQPILYSNTIRTLLYADNAIWIGTGAGVNKYNLQTDKIEFIGPQNLPLRFYNSINEDKSGNIWFCTNDSASLYWYNKREQKFHSIYEHFLLKKYVRFASTSYVLEDSKKRLWISFGRKGVLMLDKLKATTNFYQATDTGKHSLIGNQVIDIKEGGDGKIWAATFTGLSCFDPEKNSFFSYNDKNGLAGSMVSSLAIDSLNRVWVGVNGGLTMISADRQRFTVFLESDGLPSVGFPEHAAIQTNNGEIVMPTYKGYFLFNPLHYTVQKSQFPFYVTGYSIFDKSFYRINEEEKNTIIRLKPSENSFTFHLAALNYSDPAQTWFAYRLEGFEKEWHYTKDPKAVYTNVPGGNYTFNYKASAINSSWNEVAARFIKVKLGNHFYKTSLFYILMSLFILSLTFLLYRYRLRQKEKLMLLENKAQSLEKEKALVMYEGLKQQLNPHFLFNSLTSLNSLINTEPKTASSFLDSLSKTYRYILKSRDSETVALGDELKFAENYVKLQQTRFEKGFEVRMNVPEEYHHHKIVPVTLQNLIENAIKHNIIDEDSPLFIEVYVSDDYLIVQNNLQKKNFVETSNKQGLSNLLSLYSYLSNLPLEIREKANLFIVKVPLV